MHGLDLIHPINSKNLHPIIYFCPSGSDMCRRYELGMLTGDTGFTIRPSSKG